MRQLTQTKPLMENGTFTCCIIGRVVSINFGKVKLLLLAPESQTTFVVRLFFLIKSSTLDWYKIQCYDGLILCENSLGKTLWMLSSRTFTT